VKIEVPSVILPIEKLIGVYALQVRGSSMVDALIGDGDIVLVRYQESTENGQMVVAFLEDEKSVTLKHFYRGGDERIQLKPAKMTMESISIDAAKVRIQGIVVGVLRSLM
jgi:repressor LexA